MSNDDNFIVVSNITQYNTNSTPTSIFIQGSIYESVMLQEKTSFRISEINVLATNPSVATFKSGYFVVVWEIVTQNGSDPGIYGQIFNERAEPIGNPFVVPRFVTGLLFSSFSSLLAFLVLSNIFEDWKFFPWNTQKFC